MANIHPPILHNLLSKEMSFRSICHLPYLNLCWLVWGKPTKIHNNLNAAFSPSHLDFFFYLSHPFVFISSFHFPLLFTFYNTIPLPKISEKILRKKTPAVPAYKNLLFCTLHFHCLLISSCQVPDTHSLILVRIPRCCYNTNSITISNSFK